MSDEDPPAGPAVPPLLNAANVLTVVRIVLVPVFAAFTVVSGMTIAGWRINFPAGGV